VVVLEPWPGRGAGAVVEVVEVVVLPGDVVGVDAGGVVAFFPAAVLSCPVVVVVVALGGAVAVGCSGPVVAGGPGGTALSGVAEDPDPAPPGPPGRSEAAGDWRAVVVVLLELVDEAPAGGSGSSELGVFPGPGGSSSATPPGSRIRDNHGSRAKLAPTSVR